MSLTKLIEYDTCINCGEPVRRLTMCGLLGKVRSRTTTHVRHVRDERNRCKYDDGPYTTSVALAPFPGDI